MCAWTAHQVEARVDSEVDVSRDLLRRRLAELHSCRALVRSLEEDALAVDRHDPVAHRHRPNSSAHLAAMAHLVTDRDLDLHVVERLVSHRTRPPQRRVLHPHRPLDSVDPDRQRLLDGALGEVPDRRSHRHRAGLVAVEVGDEREVRAVGVGVGVAAQHPQPADPHRPRALEPDVLARCRRGSNPDRCSPSAGRRRSGSASRCGRSAAAHATSIARRCSARPATCSVTSNSCGKK